MEYPISNVQIEKIYRSKADKNGKPYISSKDNPFTKVDIYIDPRTIDDRGFQGKMTYFDYFDNTASWEQGSTISGKIVIKESNGRTYYNFELPASGKKALELEIKELQDAVKELQEAVFGVARQKKVEQIKEAIGFSKEALADSGEDVDDLPF